MPAQETQKPAEPEQNPPQPKAIRLLIVEDHTIVRQMISTRLQSEPDIEVVGEAADGQMAIDLAYERDPDVIVMDVSLPGMNGIAATHHITVALPHIRVIVLSFFEKEILEGTMLEAGAVQFLNKASSFEELLAAIREGAKVSSEAEGPAQ